MVLIAGTASCQAIGWAAVVITGYEYDTRECPYCSETIQDGLNTCPKCGGSLK